MIRFIYLSFIILFTSVFSDITAQVNSAADYANPKEYEIADITVEGSKYLDGKTLISFSGLYKGQKIFVPGEDIQNAIKKLWSQNLLSDLEIYAQKFEGDKVYLVYKIEERPRLTKYKITGIKKSETEAIRGKLNLRSGSIFTQNIKMGSIKKIKSFYAEKGYFNTDVTITAVDDTIFDNQVVVFIDIERGEKVKIDNIIFLGNEAVSDRKLKKQLKGTHEKVKLDLPGLIRNSKKKKKKYNDLMESLSDISISRAQDYAQDYVNLNIFKSAKFDRDKFQTDKQFVIDYYNTLGYRDSKILKDSIDITGKTSMDVFIKVEEGYPYYFRHITWSGNTKYVDSTLSKILNIKKGDIYNRSLLEEKLYMSQSGWDVSSLYMDDGYLFFSINPVEQLAGRDSIDLEIRISEGPQATIDKVLISGNTKTNEHVIRRELRVLPGAKFSRSDLIRSQREIANMGYFDPEQIEVVPMPNPEKGTVDIIFKVVEKPSDQLELSAGWGGRGNGVVGTLGLSFTNFSLSNIFKKGAWRPLPTGDGQRLSLRIQSSGKQYQSYNFSFTEPWLGGKKPNAFTVGFVRSRLNELDFTNNDIIGSLKTTRLTLALGTRLKWPDDFFTIQPSLVIETFVLNDFPDRRFNFSDGRSNNISLGFTLARNSIDQPLFPSRGSSFSLTARFTPPYSAIFNARKSLDYSDPELADEIRFRWLEYHKWRFDAEWYTPLVGKLVFRTAAKLGFLGIYNKDIGLSPFERFSLGGDGLSNNVNFLVGRDIIALRGYEEITPDDGSPIFNKFTMELRYPFSTNPSATIFGLVFAEGGNFYNSFKEYNPFDLQRSFGFGLRVFLPMFGLLGFDYGIGFDKADVEVSGSNIFKYGKFSIVLGVEPD
ncbi:MAG: BamA/TamA family outer membrane protein [Chitinophagales bacterium]|nr:BamA/TamA family outer membrane protein [Chitinophagales bacterium]